MFLEREKKIARHKKPRQNYQNPSLLYHFSGKGFPSPPKVNNPAPDCSDFGFLHNEIGPCLTRAKWLGNMPLRLSITGVEFKYISWRMLYSVASYLGSLGLIIPTVIRLCNPAHYKNKFDEILFSQMYIAMFVPYLFSPLTTWLDAPHLATYFNCWVNFQKLHFEVTGKLLALHFRLWSTRLLRMNTFTSIIAPCLWMIIPPHLTPLGAITIYIYSLQYVFTSQIIWKYSCNSFEIAGHSVVDCFQEELNDVGSPISALKVNQYKRLWVKLSELPGELSYATYRIYTVKTLVMFFSMTLSLYGIFNCLQNKDIVKLCLFLSMFTFSLGPFYIICNSGHWVPRHIKDGMENILKNFAPSEFHTSVRDEMSAFLQVALAQKCSINLGGFIDIDRQLLQAAGATTVTYLIVLLQFKISLPGDNAMNINDTLSVSTS